MVFKIYKDSGSNWRWILLGRNKNVIAISGESFDGRQECLRSISLIKANLPTASVIEDNNIKHLDRA
jgi:uncharacterized protein YegP (UPF0339 family)